MVLEGILTELGKALTNPYSYWFLVIIVSLFMFFGMKLLEVPKFYAGISSILLTTLLLEIGITGFFDWRGIPLTFGTYDINLPVFGTQTIGTGVMLMRLLDFIFNFGLFREVGIPYLEAFSKTIPPAQITHFPTNVTTWALTQSITSSWFNFGVFLYVSMDSIIEFLFLGVVFWGILIIIMDFLNSDTRNARTYAYILALVPVIGYCYFISNPFFEYKEAMPSLQKVSYFLNHADTTSLVLFWGTLIISFLLVTEVIAVFVSLFISAGAKTFRPSWESKVWQFNTQGMGFIYTLSFAIMYALHQYPWFVFFPAIVLYTLFKKLSSGAIDVVKEHEDKQEMKDFLQTVSGKKQKRTEASGGMSGVLMAVLVIATVIVGYLFLSELGWV